MRRHSRLVPAAAAVLAAVLALTALAGCGSSSSAPTSSAPEAAGPAGPSGRVVANVDVDGDGSRDPVTYRVLDGDRVRVGVSTDATADARTVLDTELWPGRGGYWHGAAPLDGDPGVELFVGTTMGAHTPLFTVLTMRAGRLQVQRSPLPGGPEWWVDAFANGYAGWTRSVTTQGAVRLVSRTVFRQGASHLWSGERRAFRWVDERWVAAGTRDVRIRGDRAAARIGGWHVAGLARWPAG